MAFRLPAAELEHLDAAPLKLAILQVRYRPLLAVEQSERVADFQASLSDAYELRGTKQATQTIRVFIGESAVEQLPPAGFPEGLWRFEDPARGWVIALSSTSLGFEASSYHDFDAFAEEFGRILDSFCNVFAPKTLTRLGMRYVNAIEDERLNGDGLAFFLRDDLIKPLGGELGWDLASSLSDLRFIQPDGVFVFRHGLTEPASYLLDFDYFVEEERKFDRDFVMSRASSYHSVIESMFVWSLGSGYLEELTGSSQKGSG